MRALRLDYQRSARRVPWPGVVLLGTALAALALTAGYTRQLGRDIAVWESRVDHEARLAGHRAGALRPATAEAVRAQVLEVQHANQVLRQISLPWDALFSAVEASGGKDVALLSMEPDLKKGTVTISAEAKDFDAMLEYVRQLGKREVFGSVLLQRHQVQQTDPQKPVRFSLRAMWKGEAP
jgi:hypothetical protein